MRPMLVGIFSLALALPTACDKGGSDESAASGSGQAAPAAPTPEPPGCAPLSVTIDGEPMTVGSVHAYTGVGANGDVFGEFVRASEAADESCPEILANTGVTRGGQGVRYITAFASPQNALYHTIMISGWSQTGVSLDYTEHPDGTRAICVQDEVRFTGPGDHTYVVVGQLTGPYCGNMQM